MPQVIDKEFMARWPTAKIVRTPTDYSGVTLTDLTSDWSEGLWAGYFVGIVGGQFDGQVRQILGNTATALTIDSAFTSIVEAMAGYDPADDSVYVIFEGLGGAGQGTALASLAGTVATRTGAAQVNNGARGIHLRVAISAYTDSTYTPSIQVLSADGSTWVTIWTAAAGLASAVTGLYQLYPGNVAGSGSQYTAISGIALPTGQFRIVLAWVTSGAGAGATTLVDYLLIR
ncbi:MAG: hypothetical protein Q8R28_11245 [Dehalococcoidia bacterium]|nr:hypothetical protein [Dehalococcoidia bacterium]